MNKEDNSEVGFTLQDWVDATGEKFNLLEEFNEQVHPILKQLEEKCIELGIPFYTRFVVSGDERSNGSVSSNNHISEFRTTQELIAYGMLETLRPDAPLLMLDLVRMCKEKYGSGSQVEEEKVTLKM